MEKFKIIFDEDEESYKISLFNDNLLIGNYTLYIVYENYVYFEDYIDSFIGDFIFPCLTLNYVHIEKTFRGLGFGNKLMNHLIDIALKQKIFKNFQHIYLYANPYDFSLMDLNLTKIFYSKFGFEILPIDYSKLSKRILLRYNDNLMFKKIN